MKNSYDVIIIGSGAAGFSTADWLYSFGITDICIVTENVNFGTSRNAGSDKQTYYKLDLCSKDGDSVRKMAEDLYSGGSMNGSDALIEAANSLRCFMRLVELGVAFPSDSFGQYIGYQTDHDSTARATSAGPLTSKYMTEQLQKKVLKNKTEILDGYQAIKLIVKDNVCQGVVCLAENEFKTIAAKAVILCTGAPAAIYSRSVYPENQCGATGLAIEAGAELSNFQEWQYGLASTKFRWNLSGSYQQVIPGYCSIDESGEEKEFLIEGKDKDEIYSKVFLKGYQWPFDSKKTDGSSEIDLLVFNELNKGNRVFLDYTKDPEGFCFEGLSRQAQEYLTDTECFGDTPYSRLEKLNPKAIKLYLDNGIDLRTEKLEISLCAQHNNGGIKTDINSESSVENLFAVGEAAGKFGVYRPGGSALNDTQVGGLRAAKYLASKIASIPCPEIENAVIPEPLIDKNANLDELKSRLATEMSDCAGVLRDYEKIEVLSKELEALKDSLFEKVTISDRKYIGDFFRFKLTLLSQWALCKTEMSSISTIGSRGGCICFKEGKQVPENEEYRKYITVTAKGEVSYLPVDSIPDEKTVFEKLLKNT